MKKNFGLSEAEFNQMVRALQNGDETIFEKVFLSHFKDCMSYLKNHAGASHEDAYDATMDAMLDFCGRLKANKIQYGNLRFLFTRMAKQMHFKRKKKMVAWEDIEGIDLIGEAPRIDPEMLAVLQKVWPQLCDSCSKLLKAFYYGSATLKEFAETQGKTAGAIRKQKQRCLEKLRTLFVQQL